MLTEFRKASKALSTHNPSIKAIRFDFFFSAETVANESRRGASKSGHDSTADKVSEIIKREFVEDIGVPVGDVPELR